MVIGVRANRSLQAEVEIREREDAAENRAHDDGAPRELQHRVAAPPVDLLVPLLLDLGGRALETGEWELEFRLVGRTRGVARRLGLR
jgi:hypothetical protein